MVLFPNYRPTSMSRYAVVSATTSHEENTRRPAASLLITGEGRFPQILNLFQGLKTGVPSGCLGNLDF